MAIKPAPVLFTCPKCHWNKLFAPQSDALIESPPSKCPKCGREDLEVKPAGLLDNLAASFGKLLRG